MALGACSPALDWRQVEPPGLGVSLSFPCRPASHEREVLLARQRLRMQLYACKTAGMTFAVASADVGDVRMVGVALRDLSESAARNLAAAANAGRPVQVPGMTPNEDARRFVLEGRLPSGEATIEHLAVFARGARVYQATVIGAGPSTEAVGAFFDAIRLDS
jgi:hypothetical protein